MKRLVPTISLLAVSGLLLSACITIPVQLKGEYAALSPENTTEQDLETQVRWGGMVLETRPEADHTCLEILSKELQKSMRPAKSDEASGRFIACKPGFYDPEVFEKGRDVTLTGKIIHIDRRKVGDYDYRFPVVEMEFISLWPKQRERSYYGFYGAYQPYYWHYPHYRMYFRYPYH